MQSKYFHLYQFLAWLGVYAFITGSIFFTRGLSPYEPYFALSLIGGAALYSYFIRYLFIRFCSNFVFFGQLVYFTVQAMIGASIGAFCLVVCVLLFSHYELIIPIPSASLAFAAKTMFWGNWYNVLLALVFWSFFYLLIGKIRQLYATKEALASSQLEVLSQQLNPHFLFNTLNNIRASILEEPHKARDSLAQLSDMLRYTLNQHPKDKVLLQEELSIVEEYIALCKIQFEDRLEFSVKIEPEALGALIPKMLLQLCAENAIKHGISRLAQGGEVGIDVSVVDDKLQLKVTNPVPEKHAELGIDDVKQLQASVDKNVPDYLSAGVGLRNIRSRLALLYARSKTTKPSLTLDIQNEQAVVNITIPLQFSEQDK
jgi:hypothetical protein